MKLERKKFINVKSTNDEAIKMIRRNKTKATLISSLTQSNGRGTRGKKWISKKGNIFASVYFAIDQNKINFDTYAILNPLIIKKVLEKYSKYKVYVKWPNDILIKEKKVCGILQEVISYKNKKYLIVGIGINTLFSIKEKNFKSICLKDCSKSIVKNDIILNKIKKEYENFLFNLKNKKINYFKSNFIN